MPKQAIVAELLTEPHSFKDCVSPNRCETHKGEYDTQWCIVCEHWHDLERKDKCSHFSDGGPLFSSNVCQCPKPIHLNEVHEALYTIRQCLPHWGVPKLELLAKALHRRIPKLPSRADARVHGAQAFEKAKKGDNR